MGNERKEYRSRLDIIAAVLRASMGGATKTRLMNSAFLSFKQADHYLSSMVDNELLELNDKIYLLSRNGQKFLNTYERLTKRLDDLIPREQHQKKTRTKRRFGELEFTGSSSSSRNLNRKHVCLSWNPRERERKIALFSLS